MSCFNGGLDKTPNMVCVNVNGTKKYVNSIWGGINNVATQLWNKEDDNGFFVAITTVGEVFLSKDGITWEKTADIDISNCSLTYGNGKFVCVGNKGKSYYSIDGITWMPMAGLPTVAFYDVCYDFLLNKFVCIGYTGNSYYSTDGCSWLKMNGGTTASYWRVASGNGKIACFDLNRKAYYSNNGIDWISGNFVIDSNNGVATIMKYGNNKFICVSAGNGVFQSIDGNNWYLIGKIPSSLFSINTLTYGNGLFIGAYNEANAFLSKDGINWTKFEIGNTTNVTKGMCYGRGKYICGVYNKGMYYSLDGINWKACSGAKPLGSFWCTTYSAVNDTGSG